MNLNNLDKSKKYMIINTDGEAIQRKLFDMGAKWAGGDRGLQYLNSTGYTLSHENEWVMRFLGSNDNPRNYAIDRGYIVIEDFLEDIPNHKVELQFDFINS